MDYNEEISDIRDELLDNMPSTYSKVKGCWLWEMMKSFALKIYDFLTLLTDTADKLNIENLKGDELDAYVKQWTDITRKTAAYASGYITATGNGTIYSGTIVADENNVQFEVTSDVVIDGSGEVPIVAVLAGESGNAAADTITVMVTSNANIDSITNSDALEGGADEESDDALRSRYYTRLSMPATSGNKAHYIMWATECAGVGGAKATRDDTVSNKVNVYICDDDGNAASDTIVQNVQDYIDPNINGDGSGAAPIGAICEAFSAGIKYINISANVELDNTQDEDTTIDNIKTAIVNYLSQINFNKTEVSYARLLNLALSSDGVNDVEEFVVNDGYVNVTCDETEIFTLGDFEMEVQ